MNVPGPAGAATLELQLGEVRQLFNTMDPAPFDERDLDPNAEAFIVEWARERPAAQPLAMIVRVARAQADAQTIVPEAVRAYFTHRAAAERRRLRQLLRNGRTSLLVGLLFLVLALLLGDIVAGLVARERTAYVLQESFVIGGWVALWRPLEIYLYDWWPILAEARLYDRLGAAAVEVRAG